MKGSTITVDEAKQQKTKLYCFITVTWDLSFFLKEKWGLDRNISKDLYSSENMHDSSMNEFRQAQTPQ